MFWPKRVNQSKLRWRSDETFRWMFRFWQRNIGAPANCFFIWKCFENAISYLYSRVGYIGIWLSLLIFSILKNRQ